MTEPVSKDQWHKWGDHVHWPDWKDAGRRIEARYQDGTTANGKLEIEDMTPGPDETPMFIIRKDNGERASFVDCVEFRYE